MQAVLHNSLLAVKTNGVTSAKLKHDINLLLERVNRPSSHGQMCTNTKEETGGGGHSRDTVEKRKNKEAGRTGGHLPEMSTVCLVFMLLRTQKCCSENCVWAYGISFSRAMIEGTNRSKIT